MPSVITIDPATTPVSLADAKSHLRVERSDDDDLITRLITAATDYVQADLGQQLVSATRRLRMDAWPLGGGYIELDYPPLIAVTSIAYLDTNGDSQTWSSDEYDVQVDCKPGRVYLGYNQTWPTIRDVNDAVTVTYTCGYGADSDVPENIISAILMLVAGWFENRLPHGESSRAVDALLSSASHGRYP